MYSYRDKKLSNILFYFFNVSENFLFPLNQPFPILKLWCAYGKIIKKKTSFSFFKSPQNHGFTVRRGGGAQNVTDRSVTFRFFTPSLKNPGKLLVNTSFIIIFHVLSRLSFLCCLFFARKESFLFATVGAQNIRFRVRHSNSFYIFSNILLNLFQNFIVFIKKKKLLSGNNLFSNFLVEIYSPGKLVNFLSGISFLISKMWGGGG